MMMTMTQDACGTSVSLALRVTRGGPVSVRKVVAAGVGVGRGAGVGRELASCQHRRHSAPVLTQASEADSV